MQRFIFLLIFLLQLNIGHSQQCLDYGKFDGPYGRFQNNDWRSSYTTEYDNLEEFQMGNVSHNVLKSSPSGGTFVGFHVSINDPYPEHIERTFYNLKLGENYTISFWWMSVYFDQSSFENSHSKLSVTIDGEEFLFDSANEWELAQANFTAKKNAIKIIVTGVNEKNKGYVILDDFENKCCSFYANLDLNIPDTIMIHENNLLQINPGQNANQYDHYSWKDSQGNSFKDWILEEFIKEDKEFTFNISNNDCNYELTLNVLTFDTESIYLGNVFRPQSEFNSHFFIQGEADSRIKIKKFEIYDRWGSRVFFKENIQINNPLDGWDGYYKGEILNPSIFVYVVSFEVDKRQYQKKGNLLLIQ